MAKKVFNMQGGLHSAAALSAFLDAAFTGDVAKGLNVTETGTTGLKVLVQPGTGQIHTGQNFSRIIQVDAAEEVTLSAASPSNPRNDLVVAYIDNTVTTTTGVVDNINDVLKFAAVAGTPAGSPTDPSGATIQSAIGAGNPYIVLGRVRVAQSATSLTNSNIDDLRSLVIISNSNQLSSGIIVTRHINNSAVTGAKIAMSPAVLSSFDPGGTDRTRTSSTPAAIPSGSATSFTSQTGRVKILMSATIGVNAETGQVGVIRSDTGAYQAIIATNQTKAQHAGEWIFSVTPGSAISWTPAFSSQSASSTITVYSYNPARMTIQDVL